MKLSVTSVEYKIVKNKPIIHLFCRDINGRRYILKDSSFLPYFYVRKKDWLLSKLLQNKGSEVFRSPSIKKIKEVSTKSVDNYDLVRVTTNVPPQVRQLRKQLEDIKSGDGYITTYEADIMFPLRYLIDNNIRFGVDYDLDLRTWIPYDKDILPSNLKTLYLDIEVYAEKIPDLREANSPIIVIGIYDNLEKRYYILHTASSNTSIDYKSHLHSNPKLVENIFCKDEKSLIFNFISLIRRLEPDVILTFTTFDLIYIISRCKKLHIPYWSLSPTKVVSVFNDERVRIHGVQVLDLAEMYRTVIKKLKWEILEAVSRRELGYGRIYYRESVVKMWDEDYRKVLYRNIRDVELIKELDKTCSLLTYYDAIRRVVGCNLRDTLYASRIADVLYLREVYGKTVLFTKSPKKKIHYLGALVVECKKGVYNDVLVVDFKEMYPTIIDTFNISWDTYDRKGEIVIDDTYRFLKSPKGWTPKIMNKLRPIRENIKQKMKYTKDSDEYRRLKAISDGYKAVINALYGMYGFAGDYEKHIPASRLYNVEIAECITYLGRTILKYGVIPSLKELGYKIIYGDTDSIFIKLNKRSNVDAIVEELNKKIQQFVKDRWNVDSKLKLEVDTVFKRLILFTKKKYKGRTVKGKTIVKGLEEIRRDTSEVTADVQEKISKMVLNKRSKSSIIQYIKGILEEYKQYPLTYISIPKRLTKKYKSYKGVIEDKGIPEHVKAFKRGIDMLGEELVEGDRFYLLHVIIPKKVKNMVNEHELQTTLIPVIKNVSIAMGYKNVDKLKDYRIDYDKMIKLTIEKKIEDLLELLHIEWKSII